MRISVTTPTYGRPDWHRLPYRCYAAQTWETRNSSFSTTGPPTPALDRPFQAGLSPLIQLQPLPVAVGAVVPRATDGCLQNVAVGLGGRPIELADVAHGDLVLIPSG